MAVTLDPWVIGHPYRIKPLEEASAYIKGHERVWAATGADILAAFRAQQQSARDG